MKLINDVTAQCIRDWNTRSVGENEQVVRALLDGMTTILQQFKHDDDLNGMTVNSETRFETRSNYHFTLLQGILAKSVIDERETCELIAWMCHRGAGSAQPLHKYIGRHKPNETVAWTRALLARLFAGTSQPTQCDGGVEVWIRSVTCSCTRKAGHGGSLASSTCPAGASPAACRQSSPIRSPLLAVRWRRYFCGLWRLEIGASQHLHHHHHLLIQITLFQDYIQSNLDLSLNSFSP